MTVYVNENSVKELSQLISDGCTLSVDITALDLLYFPIAFVPTLELGLNYAVQLLHEQDFVSHLFSRTGLKAVCTQDFQGI